ncbi:hypothetical protein RYX36_012546 [Vicia faba]
MGSSVVVLDSKPVSEPLPSLLYTKSEYLYTGDTTSDKDDLYSRLKSLQRQLEFIDIQKEYVKDEQKNLKRELLRAQEEVKSIQSVPLVICQFMEMVDQNNIIIGSTTEYNYYVRILSTINYELFKPFASVALHRHSNALVDVFRLISVFRSLASLRSLMSLTMILEDVISRSRKFVRMYIYLSHIMIYTRKLVLILLEVSYYMAPLELVKQCLPKLLLIIPLSLSSGL